MGTSKRCWQSRMMKDKLYVACSRKDHFPVLDTFKKRLLIPFEVVLVVESLMSLNDFYMLKRVSISSS